MSKFEYAGFWRRTFASFIDSILVSVVIYILTSVMGRTLPLLILYVVIGWGYFITLTAWKGQTLGKMITKIRVINLDSGKTPGVGAIILRETIGKFLSNLVFSLGYLWAAWDRKKQSWHDKMAGTIVVKV